MNRSVTSSLKGSSENFFKHSQKDLSTDSVGSATDAETPMPTKKISNLKIMVPKNKAISKPSKTVKTVKKPVLTKKTSTESKDSKDSKDEEK